MDALMRVLSQLLLATTLVFQPTLMQKTGQFASFGVLSDVKVSREFVEEALDAVWRENQIFSLDENVTNFPAILRMEGGLNVVDPTDPSDVLREVCQLMTYSPSFVLFVTDCNRSPGLSYLAGALRFPILQVGATMDAKCRVSSYTGQRWVGTDTSYLVETPTLPGPISMRRRKRRAATRFGRQAIPNPIPGSTPGLERKIFWDPVDQALVGNYFAGLRWSILISLYDYSFDFASIQNVLEPLGRRMRRSVIQKLPVDQRTGYVVSRTAKNLIKNILTEVECSDTGGQCQDRIVFALFCSERTTKKFIIELLPYFSLNKRVHFYIVDVGWTRNFLKAVLFTREFSIIARQQKKPSRQVVTYKENMQYLKSLLQVTLDAGAKALFDTSLSPSFNDANMSCTDGTFYPEEQANDFLSAVRREFGVFDPTVNGTEQDNDSFPIPNERRETFLNVDVLKSSQSTNQYQYRSDELKLCGLSDGGQVECKSLRDQISEVHFVHEEDYVGLLCRNKNNCTSRQATRKRNSNINPLEAIANRTLRVVTIEDPPFVMIHRKNGATEFRGFSIDLLNVLAERANFKYKIYEVADKKYGSYSNGSWNGLVADLIANKADIAISAMTITPQRQQHIDFAARYMDYAVGIVMKKTASYPTLFSFLEPFHDTVWYCILAGWFSVSILLFILNRISPTRRGVWWFGPQNLRETFWSVYSTLVQQGGGSELRNLPLSSQIVTGVWWFSALILVSSYTANLAALLIVARRESNIHSLAQLARQTDIQYGTVEDSSIFDHLRVTAGAETSSHFPFWQNIWKTVSSQQNIAKVATEGFRRVKESDGSFAFLWDVAALEYHVHNDPACSLQVVRDYIFEKGYGIGVQKGDPIKDALSLNILEMQEQGAIQQMRARWWSSSFCASSNAGFRKPKHMGLDCFTGVFGILIGGMVFASVVALFEICFKSRKSHKRGNQDSKVSESINGGADLLVKTTNTHPNVTFDKTNDDSIRIVISGIRTERWLTRSLQGKFTNSSSIHIPHATRVIPEDRNLGSMTNGSSDSNGIKTRKLNGHVPQQTLQRKISGNKSYGQ